MLPSVAKNKSLDAGDAHDIGSLDLVDAPNPATIGRADHGMTQRQPLSCPFSMLMTTEGGQPKNIPGHLCHMLQKSTSWMWWAWTRTTRLVIPVWQEFIFWTEKQKNTGFLRIFFHFLGGRNSFTGTWFWRGLQNSCFQPLLQDFLQVFLQDRNSCISTKLLQIPPDSSGFLQDSCSQQNCLALASQQILPQLALPVASPPRILTDKCSQALRALHQRAEELLLKH